MKYSSLIIIIMLTSIFISTSINIKSYPDVYEQVGQECDESGTISKGYLDVISLEVKHTVTNEETDRIYFYLILRSNIPNPSGFQDGEYYKWLIKLDTDLDSRTASGSTSFYEDYIIVIKLDKISGSHVDILKKTGTGEQDIGDGIVEGGGPENNYWIISVSASNFDNLGNVFFIKVETKEDDGDALDNAPGGTSGNGDYWIYYINPPATPPGGDWTSIIPDDTNGDDENLQGKTPGVDYQYYHDIHYIRYDFDGNNLYFQMEVVGNIPWCGGGSTAFYQIYIDVDPGEDNTGDPAHCLADYKLEFRPGYVVYLFYYTGSGWDFVIKEFWPHAPGSENYENLLTIITPRSDYNHKPLGNSIRIISETRQGTFTVIDSAGACEPAPVPELSMLSLIAVCIVLLRILFMKK